MVTIKDVAKRCGYSVCTVSRALSGKGYLKEETKPAQHPGCQPEDRTPPGSGSGPAFPD